MELNTPIAVVEALVPYGEFHEMAVRTQSDHMMAVQGHVSESRLNHLLNTRNVFSSKKKIYIAEIHLCDL